ncbi:MAG: hypothetical protein KDF59_15945 [Nitrosomonas sp.]|nr:hypothetical protein [Nitrosomonas sp.]
MKTPTSFGSDASPSVGTILQQINEGLNDLNPPSEAQCIQLYQALADEHQSAIDTAQVEMADSLRRIMVNVHLILSIAYPDSPISSPPGSGSPQTIRALMHKRD